MRTMQGILGLAAAISVALGARAASGADRAPLAQVLGITLGMPEARVHGTLARLGTRAESEGEVESEGLERELWMLRDRRYASVQVVFDDEKRLRAFQAYLKPGGRGLRYQEIGDLALARRLGYTIWQWEVPSREGKPGRRVIARGVDSTYAGSVAVTALP